MSAQVIQWHTWELQEAADRRFNRLLMLFALPALIIALIIPFLDIVGLTRGGGTLTGQQYVELINDREDAEVAEVAEEAAPAEEEQPDPVEPEPAEAETVPEPEPQPVPAATPVPRATPAPTPDPAVVRAQQEAAARQRAQEQAKVFDQLQSLRSETLSAMDAAQPLTSSSVVGTSGGSGAGAGRTASPDSIASSARSSGGISGQGAGTVRRTDAGTGLGQRTTTVIESPVGFGEDRTRPGQGGDKLIAGRSLQEIQLAFDRNKGAIPAIINRALRANPNLRGKIVVSFTVLPNGAMSNLTLVRSELGDADVEQKVLARIGLINFGAKDVPPFEVKDYPIVLL
mgnify:CR=1 FL=1